MIDGIKKFGRALRRDHLPLIPRLPILGGLAGSIGSAIVRGSISLVSAASTLVTLAIIAGVCWAAKYSRLRKKTELQMGVQEKKGGDWPRHLQGPGAKMHTIASTQTLIDKITHTHRFEALLPASLQKRIDAHVADAAEAAKHVRAIASNEEVREITFLRTIFNAAGQMAVPVGKIQMLYTPTPDEITAKTLAEQATKIAEAAQMASAVHAGSSTKLTVKTIKLKKTKHQRLHS